MKTQRNADTFARFLDAINSGRLVLGDDNQVYSTSYGKYKPHGSTDKHGRERVGLSVSGKNYLTNKTNFVWLWHTRQIIKDNHVIVHRDHNSKNYAFDNLVELHVDSEEARPHLLPRKKSNYTTKLTDEDVIAIRKIVTETPEEYASLTALGKKYGVTLPTVKQAILGITFAHLAGALSEIPKIGKRQRPTIVREPKPKDPRIHNLEKLTDERVVEMRRLFVASEALTLTELAKQYALPRAATHKILEGTLFPNLPDAIPDLGKLCTYRRNKNTWIKNRNVHNERRRKTESTFVKSKVIAAPVTKQPAALVDAYLEFQGITTSEIDQKENTVTTIKRTGIGHMEVRKVTPPNSIAPHREKHFHPRRDWKPRVVRRNSLTEYDLPEGYRILKYSEVYQRLMAR